MADSPELLRETPTNVVTTQIPSGGLSPGQVEQPFRDASALLGKFSEDASDLAVPLAQRQATADLANQKVIRGPDGSVGVLNPASAMILGDAGKTYARAVQQGTLDQILASVRPDLAALHAENPLDSAALGKANGAYLDKLASTTAGMGPAGAEVMRSARDMASQHQDAAVMAGATNNIENTKKAILAGVDDAKDAITALARTPDGINKPEYKTAVENYDTALAKLGTNSLFKMPPELLALQRKQFMGEMQGEQSAAIADSIFDRKGKAEAQAYLKEKVLQNPDIPGPQAELIYRRGMAQLEYRSADQVAGQRASDQAIGALQIGLAKGTIKASDPEIAGLRKQAADAGYADGVQKIDALTEVYAAHAAVSALPAADQPAALGVPGQRAGQRDFAPYNQMLNSGDVQGALRWSEGLRTGAYFDVNHFRTGYGSDTVTRSDGTVETVGPNTRTTPADAVRDLQRRTADYTAGAAKAIGPAWGNLAPSAQAALTSIAYNYGHVPNDVARAASTGDPAAIAEAIRAHANDNSGANYNRRLAEANAVLGVKGVGAPAPSANGVPFSDADAAANPWLRAEYFRSLAESKPVREESFAAYETGSSETLKGGNPLSDDTVRGLSQLSQGDPEKEAKASELLGMNFALKAMQGGGGGGAPMSAPQIQQAIQDTFAAARDAPDHLHQVLATSAYNYFKEQEKWAADHPLQDASRRYKQAAPQPIDPQNPGALPDNIAYRGTLAQHYAQLNGSPTPSIFDKDELPQIKGILANPDPAVKGSVYGAIANLPAAVRGATLKDLGGNNPKDMAEAAAGSLMKDAPEVAQSIFRGQGLMQTDKRYDPEGEGQQKATYRADLDKALPPSTFTLQDKSDPTGAYATTATMIKARYADLSAQAGTTDYSPDRIKQAADDVTGGILSHNGGSLIAPARGMTQMQFDQTVAGVGDSDMMGAVTLGGQKVTADYVHNNAQLESVGDGRYFVKLGRDPLKPVYAYAPPQPEDNGAMRKFVLDLRNVKPGTVAAPPDAPANWMQ